MVRGKSTCGSRLGLSTAQEGAAAPSINPGPLRPKAPGWQHLPEVRPLLGDLLRSIAWHPCEAPLGGDGKENICTEMFLKSLHFFPFLVCYTYTHIHIYIFLKYHKAVDK